MGQRPQTFYLSHDIRTTLGHLPLEAFQELIKGGLETMWWSQGKKQLFFSIWHGNDCGNQSSMSA